MRLTQTISLLGRSGILGSGLLAVALCSGLAAEGPAWGPLVDAFPLTLAPGHRTEVLGPLFYTEQKELQRTWALPPLLSRTWDPSTDFDETDLAYPLITYRRFGTEYRWHVFQVFSFAGGRDQQDDENRRFTLFPIYFQQRSPVPSNNYTALFPVYGHLQNRLFRDDISFVLFPIYGQSRRKDVVTDNYLYPFFHLRHGDSLRGWQFWPLLGHEHKDPLIRTNGFGDAERQGGHDDKFLLWPVLFLNQSGMGTGNLQTERGVLPFYSDVRSAQRDSTTVLWPFFSHVTDREKKYREWDVPWPLIVFARGEGKTIWRIWPFCSWATNSSLESDFYLWPLYKYDRVHGDALDRRRTRILFYLYSDTIQRNTESGEARRRIDLWPLFAHQSDYNGSTRLQLFALLEPFLPTSPSVERDYSPLWSAWRAEWNPRTGAGSQSFLWNLYRRDTTPQSIKCSLLLGLFQYESGPGGKRLSLFYVPVIRTPPADGAHSK